MSFDVEGLGEASELTAELERIAALPVVERAAAFSQVHQQLGQVLESTPVELFDGDLA